MQRELIDQIYFRWHEVGADITSHEFLAECAEAVNFSESHALDVLRSGRYAEEVDRMDKEARENGVSCVPTFDVNGMRIEGAADATTFYESLVKAKEMDGDEGS